MMELFSTAQAWWYEYYPIVVGGITVIGGIIASVMIIWAKVQPILDKLNVIKDKVTDTSKEDLGNIFQSVDIETKITDLKEKIANPLTSEEARTSYTKQLEILIEAKVKLDAGIAKVEDTTSKF